MNQRLLHTPDGVRDIYSLECEKKNVLEQRLHQRLKTYGYHDIQTPSFEEFPDVFSQEVGTIPSRELFKFFDREGDTLVLRPDFTPSIARSAAKYYMDETRPIRMCYMGNTFVNNSSYQGRLKESTQLGAELLGDASPEADAEMIAMVIELLLDAGTEGVPGEHRAALISLRDFCWPRGWMKSRSLPCGSSFPIKTILALRSSWTISACPRRAGRHSSACPSCSATRRC